MPERGSDPQSYLAEIDRRLRAIQAELAPVGTAANPGSCADREHPAHTREHPAHTREHPAGYRRRPGGGRTGPLEMVLERAGLQKKLLTAIDELIAAYERPIAEVPTLAGEVLVSAGPFTTIAELRRFEHALSELPGVREVSVRGYEGTDRAIIEVRLGPKTVSHAR